MLLCHIQIHVKVNQKITIPNSEKQQQINFYVLKQNKNIEFFTVSIAKMHPWHKLIPFFLLFLLISARLQANKANNDSLGQKEFKKYAKERWTNFETEVRNANEWLTHQHSHSRADEVIQVLLYISRLDEPIYVGVELLKTISGPLLERMRKMAKKTATTAVAATDGQTHHGTERTAVAFMLGTSGVVPLYAKVKPDEETMEEQVELGKMIVHIVRTAKEHRTHRKRRLFHKIVGEVFADSGLKTASKWSDDMYKRIVKWDKNVNDRLRHLSLKKVALGLKDVALWLTSPENVSGVVQLILYFTNLGTPIKISLEILSALGIDETFTRIAAKMGVRLAQNGVNQRLAMWAFGPNGVVPLFVRQGEKVDPTEVMDSIDRASLWYYYKKEPSAANRVNIRCKLAIHTDDGDEEGKKKCAWKVRHRQKGEEEVEKQMEEHLLREHPARHGEKQRAQREKEEIIRRADIWHYFQTNEKIGAVKCKLSVVTHRVGGKIVDKCNWKTGIEKAEESELNDHLSLEHLAEFEQRLKAMREKELPIRHIHDAPLNNSLTLFQSVTMSMVLNKGRPMDQLVDIVLQRLHNWERRLLAKWKRRWERVKRIQFRDVYEAFKHAAMWLITPKHINSVLKVLFIITMLDAPIYLSVEILKAFGIQRYITRKLDKASLAIKKRYDGTELEKSLLFMIGEGGMVRLFLEGEHRSDLSLTGSAELLHTVIMTVVQSPATHAHSLAFTAMEELRELRLELSLVRGWNTCWPQITERYRRIKTELSTKRVEKIGESIRHNVTAEFGKPKPEQKTRNAKEAEEKQKQQQQQEEDSGSSEASVEIVLNSPSNKSDVSTDVTIISRGTSLADSTSSEHSVELGDEAAHSFDEHSVMVEHEHEQQQHVDGDADHHHQHNCDADSFVVVEHHRHFQDAKGRQQNDMGTEKSEQRLAKPKKKSAKGCSPIAKMFKMMLKSPKKPSGGRTADGAQKRPQGMANEEPSQEQQSVPQHSMSLSLHGQGSSIQSVGGSTAGDYRDSDESVQSVIIEGGTEEEGTEDCPKKMEESVGQMQFYELLLRSDADKCRTVQIRSQKFEVVEDFLDEAIRTIIDAESEGDVPPVINLRLGNKIALKSQSILAENFVRSASVMFLHYKMAQVGVAFDCDASSARPLEYAFQGPKGKMFILLLPACAEESGKISEFAIFKADYFDDGSEILMEIPIEGDSD